MEDLVESLTRGNVIAVVTAKFGPTSAAELEAREDRLKERQELREERLEERQERLEERREESR